MRLVCVRHGETDWNKKGKIQGVTDTSLNENGIKAAGEFLKRLRKTDFAFKKVYTSPLKRAFETGDFVAKEYNIPIIKKEGLKELCFGKFEGLSWDEVRAKYRSEYDYWHVHRKDAAPPEGESYHHKSDDIIDAFKEIIGECGEQDDVLIVSHSASLKALLCPIRHVDYNDMLKHFAFGNLQEVVLSDNDIKEILKYKRS
ncbi:MAG: histidine phosphatase family protein [Lachnospiraceae bacterium]|nr:histidine phosphatase family protein [Lachnospiraceae bacterium]